MANFVELKEAAKMLRLTPDQLVEMRSNGEIHGYRDGTSWKFKVEEVERVLAERGVSPARAPSTRDDEGSIPFDDEDESVLKPPRAGVTDEDDSVLVSEEELGHSGESTSSTVIGKSGEAPESESDLKLTAEEGSEVELEEGVPSDVMNLVAGPGVDSDVTLVPGVGTDSDVSLVPDPGSDREMGAVGSDAEVLAGSDLELQSASSGGTGRLEAVDSDMSIGSSDLDLSIDSGLALSDDDDMVLSGSSGSDLALSAADSGINLASPSDSGLSLEADSDITLQAPTDSGLSLEEEPLEMGGSSISSLELPEDEEVVALEEPVADADMPTEVKRDEEFLLSPTDEMVADESDSGSQVIALEDSEAFDQEAATMLQTGGPALLAETAGLEAQLDSLAGGGVVATPAMAPAPAFAPAAELPEAPYSVWNIAGLLLIVLCLSLTGVVMTDIVRNMWAWEEGGDVSTSISDGVTRAIFGQ